MSDSDALQRIAALEAHHDDLLRRLRSMDEKLDGLVKTAAVGQGAWIAILKIGGLLTALGAIGIGVWQLFHST